jgi:hypothetical protein
MTILLCLFPYGLLFLFVYSNVTLFFCYFFLLVFFISFTAKFFVAHGFFAPFKVSLITSLILTDTH